MFTSRLDLSLAQLMLWVKEMRNLKPFFKVLKILTTMEIMFFKQQEPKTVIMLGF